MAVYLAEWFVANCATRPWLRSVMVTSTPGNSVLLSSTVDPVMEPVVSCAPRLAVSNPSVIKKQIASLRVTITLHCANELEFIRAQSDRPHDLLKQSLAFVTACKAIEFGVDREAIPAHDVAFAPREALAALCQKYWHPVYAFVRRRGYDREQSQDLTQGFFALLIEKNYLMDPDRMLRLSQAIGDPNVFDATGLVHAPASETAAVHRWCSVRTGRRPRDQFRRADIDSSTTIFSLSTVISSAQAARMYDDPCQFTAVFYTPSGPAVTGQLKLAAPPAK